MQAVEEADVRPRRKKAPQIVPGEEVVRGHLEEMRDATAGEHLACSLFSPVLEFADQATARAVAQHALVALLDPHTADEVGPVERRATAPLSRRELLRGRFLRAAGTRSAN